MSAFITDSCACRILLTRLNEMFEFLPNEDVPTSYAMALMTDDFWNAEKIVSEFLTPWLIEFTVSAYRDFTCLTEKEQRAVLDRKHDWSSGKSVLDLFLSAYALGSRLTDMHDSFIKNGENAVLLYSSSVEKNMGQMRFKDLRRQLRFALDEEVSYLGAEDKFGLFKSLAYHYMYILLYVVTFAATKSDHGLAGTFSEIESAAVAYFDSVLGVYAGVVNKYRALNPKSEVLERLGQL